MYEGVYVRVGQAGSFRTAPLPAVARLEGELSTVEALKDLRQELRQQKGVPSSLGLHSRQYMCVCSS